ncbi:unnamed protein product [Allacma fusca]|uniref:Uncharacterized protein n=1 Tax=Allacma fusca TaxID=39272 RepID=A0A8J2LU22_9HEXA|nr:unnamed protein product [Allacma fusca]
MCEGKFLVKTSVTTDNVIRQVTVENFRFGVRVIKKPEGRWICQDLNKINGDSHARLSLTACNGSLKDNLCRVSTVKFPNNSKEDSWGKRLLPEGNTSSEKTFVATAPSVSLEGPDFINGSCDRERGCQQLGKQCHHGRVTSKPFENLQSHDSVSLRMRRQLSPHKSTSLDSILYRHLTTTDHKSPDSSKYHKPQVLSTVSKDKSANICSNHIKHNTGELKNQYLSSILGPSPLLKLQLLNLYVAPLDGGHTFPELLPLSNVSRLVFFL